MKISFLIRSLDCGGAERQLVALARGLQQQGCLVIVAVFYSGGLLEKDLHGAGVKIHSLDKKGRWDIIGFIWRLIIFIYYQRPDVLHGYLGTSNIITVLLKPLFPRIRMVWGVRASNMDLSRYDWLARLSYRIECWLSRFADKIIVNSFAGRNYALMKGFPGNKMIVIPNGIDTERFYPDSNARRRVRLDWGMTEKEVVFGLVGRLDPMKDHPTFLRAAALLTREIGGVYFVCVGGGPDEYCRELQTLARTLGITDRLIWAGARMDMTAVYNALDILSSSSYGEGFPNVIGEAMSCGVPCVVTDVGDSACIVGNTGVVVPARSPEELAEGFKVMLERLKGNRKSISEEVRKRIIMEFGLEVLVQKTSKAISELL